MTTLADQCQNIEHEVEKYEKLLAEEEPSWTTLIHAGFFKFFVRGYLFNHRGNWADMCHSNAQKAIRDIITHEKSKIEHDVKSFAKLLKTNEYIRNLVDSEAMALGIEEQGLKQRIQNEHAYERFLDARFHDKPFAAEPSAPPPPAYFYREP